MSEELLTEAYEFLDSAKKTSTELDGSDYSVFFVQKALRSLAGNRQEEPVREVACLAYALYLAELLTEKCAGAHRVIEGDPWRLRDILVVSPSGPTYFVLSWVSKCLDDPEADNVAFRYAEALRGFGEFGRALSVYAQLAECVFAPGSDL
ncbi:hypothetical protein F3087_40090 [Nocardia colli]|uniref:Uncharacterized protein n=1 Tax=Nocardia colli TaxID=2545717 RepID=A0A5N0DYU7_9NOCA|nr:hypothetical protein [Nocardia colli]KAA8881873.1 hypothetical protein F3087_40090 [Nocardia colli]